jgi:hypothetical protein
MGNRGEVIRVGDTVRRPSSLHSPAVSSLLEHLAAEGFPAPVPTGRDEEARETFRWIEGEVPVPPYTEWSLTDDVLASAGQLLRRYHDAGRGTSVRGGMGNAWREGRRRPRRRLARGEPRSLSASAGP